METSSMQNEPVGYAPYNADKQKNLAAFIAATSIIYPDSNIAQSALLKAYNTFRKFMPAADFVYLKNAAIQFGSLEKASVISDNLDILGNVLWSQAGYRLSQGPAPVNVQ